MQQEWKQTAIYSIARQYNELFQKLGMEFFEHMISSEPLRYLLKELYYSMLKLKLCPPIESFSEEDKQDFYSEIMLIDPTISDEKTLRDNLIGMHAMGSFNLIYNG